MVMEEKRVAGEGALFLRHRKGGGETGFSRLCGPSHLLHICTQFVL